MIAELSGLSLTTMPPTRIQLVHAVEEAAVTLDEAPELRLFLF
jgi:hypothetical protein